MIIFSEIGDKTFLIAAILSMRQSRIIVFMGAFASLVVMSILSSCLGVMFPTLLPKSLTTLLASLLFFVFGAKMVQEGWNMDADEMGEEWEEAKKEIEEEEIELRGREELQSIEEGLPSTGASYPHINLYPPRGPVANGTTPDRTHPSPKIHPKTTFTHNLKEGARNLCGLCVSPTFAQAFILTFLGEWGDRSQIATIALAAAHNIVLVALGTIFGHSLCTGLAVLAGSWLAKRISIRHVTLGGAVLFLLFGFIYLGEAIAEYHSVSQAAVTGSIKSGAQAVGQGIAALPVQGGLAAAAGGNVGVPMLGERSVAIDLLHR